MKTDLDRESILETLQEHRESLEGFGVRRIGLFGSFQKGQQTAGSDIDFLVEFAPGQKTFSNYLALSRFLEQLFKRDIELLTPESLSPYIGPRILEETDYVPFGS